MKHVGPICGVLVSRSNRPNHGSHYLPGTPIDLNSVYTIGNGQPPSFSNNKGLCGVPLETCMEPHNSIMLWLAMGEGAFVTLAILVTWFLFFHRSSTKKEDDVEANEGMENLNGTNGIKLNHTTRRFCNIHISTFANSVPKMRLNALLEATNNFSKDKIIGSGRAGTMYKGTLPDGSSFAIKRLHDSQLSDKEFMFEMKMLCHLKHRNLVPLLGFCIARNERLLIYKYMPKGTLYQQLHEAKAAHKCMEWPLRLKIAIGAARGLAWLHHGCNPSIIHRKISSKRILLDEDYEPKISKFRSAGLMDPLDTHLTTTANISSDILGSVAPEHSIKVVASRAGDVYSFGVLLLELITRQKPTQVANAPEGWKGNLVGWITYLENHCLLRYAIDRSLIGKGFDDELLRFLRVAVACVVFDPEKRPTMTVVYKLLRSIGQRYNFTDEVEMQIQESNQNVQRIVVNTKFTKAKSF